MLLLLPVDFFRNHFFAKKIFQDHQGVELFHQSHDRRSVGPDLGQNRSRRLSADDKSRY